jgi:hypothetical protein
MEPDTLGSSCSRIALLQDQALHGPGVVQAPSLTKRIPLESVWWICLAREITVGYLW